MRDDGIIDHDHNWTEESSSLDLTKTPAYMREDTVCAWARTCLRRVVEETTEVRFLVAASWTHGAMPTSMGEAEGGKDFAQQSWVNVSSKNSR